MEIFIGRKDKCKYCYWSVLNHTLGYHDISPDVAGEIYLPGYDVEVSDLSIYGYGTKTVVIRAM